jgi:hypothetical protein
LITSTLRIVFAIIDKKKEKRWQAKQLN